jgi:hypothetical protein
MRVSEVKSFLRPEQIKPYKTNKETTLNTFERFGVTFSQKAVDEAIKFNGFATDEAPDMVTSASISVPVQFLQYWEAKPVITITTKRDIDKIAGRKIAGSWLDEQIVQPIVELTGRAHPYADVANPIESGYNVNYEARTIVRFENAAEVGILESERTARARLSSASLKKSAAIRALEIERNLVGFFGYTDGTNKTYGILNDVNLPDYHTVAAGAGGSTWDKKTFVEIQTDIKIAIAGLRAQTMNNFDPMSDKAYLVIAANKVDFLSTTNEYGSLTVRQWLAENYPNIEVIASAFFTGANGNVDIFYLYADVLGEDDDFGSARILDQYVPSMYRLLGVDPRGKKYIEYYSNATAGVFVKQPLGVYRVTGI